MGPDILLTVLGFPLSWATSFTYEKVKQFAEKIKKIPLQDLFIKAFYNTWIVTANPMARR